MPHDPTDDIEDAVLVQDVSDSQAPAAGEGSGAAATEDAAGPQPVLTVDFGAAHESPAEGREPSAPQRLPGFLAELPADAEPTDALPAEAAPATPARSGPRWDWRLLGLALVLAFIAIMLLPCMR